MEREARFLCKRRSTLELETLLFDFFLTEWESMDEGERAEFVKILKTEDFELERYLFKNQPIPHHLSRDVMDKLKEHSFR